MAKPLGKYLLALDGSALPSRELVGGKAWSVARMLSLGLRVPPAVVITTGHYTESAKALSRRTGVHLLHVRDIGRTQAETWLARKIRHVGSRATFRL